MTKLRCRLAVLLAVSIAAPAGAGAGSPPVRGRRARTTVKAPQRPRAPGGERRTGGGATDPTPEQQLREQLDSIWAGRILRRGVTSVYVVDARTGQDIYAVHPDDKVNPASNVKLLTTATVLDLLGPKWRYATRLFGALPTREGIVRGSIYLRGNADPTFSLADLEQLAQAAAAGGVKRVDGDVVLSDHMLRDTISAPVVLVQVSAGAPGKPPTVTVEPSSSFIQVHVDATTTTKRRPRLTVDTELLDPPATASAASGSGASSPAVSAAPSTALAPAPAAGAAPAQQTATPAAPAAATAAASSAATPAAADAAAAAAAAMPYDGPHLLIHVRGAIRAGKVQRYRRSARLRSTFTGYMLRQALRGAGVDVSGRVRLAEFDAYTREATTGGWLPIELAVHRSQSLEQLVTRVNKRSTNWLADRLLMTAGAELAGGGLPSMARGLDAMHRWMERAGMDPAKVVVDTGSGLSHRTQLTTRHIVTVLRSAAGFSRTLAPSSMLDPATFFHSLSIGGVDGTLRGRFRTEAMRGVVVGKTGTLEHSVALSGFVNKGQDDVLCFSIVTNGNRWNARYRVRREHEQMVVAMKRYLDERVARRAAATAPAAAPAGGPPMPTAPAAAGAPASAAPASEEDVEDGEDQAEAPPTGDRADSDEPAEP